jgi:hypothetical protein
MIGYSFFSFVFDDDDNYMSYVLSASLYLVSQ